MLVIRKNKYEELEKLRRKTNAIRLVEGIVIGLAIGAVIALLLTPWDGKQSRGYAAEKFEGLRARCKRLWGSCCGCCSAEVEEEEVVDPLEGFYEE